MIQHAWILRQCHEFGSPTVYEVREVLREKMDLPVLTLGQIDSAYRKAGKTSLTREEKAKLLAYLRHSANWSKSPGGRTKRNRMTWPNDVVLL